MCAGIYELPNNVHILAHNNCNERKRTPATTTNQTNAMLEESLECMTVDFFGSCRERGAIAFAGLLVIRAPLE
jgi:hypothetical protein